ncbi:serine acetyltransferase [Massilia sp. W12]|uniref:serine acetyltransferase n=1 Tax=Massilia sp. W12 TaxID=3126507 RepID=UPI0030CD5DD9
MLKLFRFYSWLHRLGIPLLPKLLYGVNRILFAVVLPPTAKIGRNVTFAYQGLGVVVHAQAVLGDDVYVGPQVIIGGRAGEKQVPVIESGVLLGAGCRVLGPVTIGRGATVAAGAVVVKDVAAGSSVAGVPAKPMPV